MDVEVDEVLKALTIEEQVSFSHVSLAHTDEQVALVSGSDFWRTVKLKNVPSIKTTDGPSGARGEHFDNGTPAALFPCGISLAATWNICLIEEIGRQLGKEAKLRGANVLLAPTVNIHRSPLGGRNFESFSEDPYLTGKIAAAYIRGVQSEGIAATIKHFVANEQETNRMTINSVVDERTLREIYLKPFEIALRESASWALMSSYNLVNGLHADSSEWLLQKVLREEWNYDGAVISDWTAIKEETGVNSVKAGCDLEMPGPTKWRGERIVDALHHGRLSPADVQRSARNILELIQRTKGLKTAATEESERSDDNDESRHDIRRAGIEGIVLLKNERGILPIKNNIRNIAVIGPNAQRCIAGGGGSAKVNPYYLISPYDGICNAQPVIKSKNKGVSNNVDERTDERSVADREILHEQGCNTSKWLPLATDFCWTSHGQGTVVVEWFKGDKFAGEPVVTEIKSSTDLYLWDSAPKQVLPDYSFRVKTLLKPKSSGKHTLSFSSVGPGRIFLNGTLTIDNWDWEKEGEAMFGNSADVLADVKLERDIPVELLVESTSETRPLSRIATVGPWGYGGVRIGYQEEETKDLIGDAVAIARDAEVAIVVVGLDNEWESEGYDRKSMNLPKDGSQDRLISAVLAAQPNTIVVIQSGSPVTMPWVDQAPVIVQAWYQGMEAGNALADILFGVASPSGKLPTTFPKRLEDNPSHGNFPGNGDEVRYQEGLFVGYRHYDTNNIEPLFPFGHGLTYTTWEYSEAGLSCTTLDSLEDEIVVTVKITNTGHFETHEIVQCYIKPLQLTVTRPEKELKAFTKTKFLRPGDSQIVEMMLDKHSFSYYSTKAQKWVAEEGSYEILIAASSVDIKCRLSLEVTKSLTWIF